MSDPSVIFAVAGRARAQGADKLMTPISPGTQVRRHRQIRCRNFLARGQGRCVAANVSRRESLHIPREECRLAKIVCAHQASDESLQSDGETTMRWHAVPKCL